MDIFVNEVSEVSVYQEAKTGPKERDHNGNESVKAVEKSELVVYYSTLYLSAVMLSSSKLLIGSVDE